MRFYVFSTKAAADAAIAAFWGKLTAQLASAGYTIDSDGHVIGKAAGVDQPMRQRTTSLAVARQRLDGKWIVPHPESFSWSNIVTPLSSPQTIAEALGTASGGGVTLEEEQASWWPAPTPLPGT